MNRNRTFNILHKLLDTYILANQSFRYVKGNTLNGATVACGPNTNTFSIQKINSEEGETRIQSKEKKEDGRWGWGLGE